MKAALLLALSLVPAARADIARWADPGIPLKDGLELWLDASRENEAREAHYMNRLAEDQPMELWHDASGKSRHLAQWTSTFRPLWKNGAVEFLGDDYLAALLSPGLESRECTIFLVAEPEQSGGDFPALFSAARREENDYTSGLTIDFGRPQSREGLAEEMNIEGAGQSEARNLLLAPVPVDRGHLFSISSGSDGSKLRVDGKDQGGRDRGQVAFAMDRVAVGARFVAPEMRHFFRGRMAEVVFYNRKLDAGEIAKVEAWLSRKHAGFLKGPDPNAAMLEPAKDAPVVQMLVDGRTVVGTRIGESDTELKIAAPGGNVTSLKKSKIGQTTALPVSLMPPGLLGTLSEQEVKDLMTFLLTSPERPR